MIDWEEERVKALVAAAEKSVERTRWVFVALNLASAVMISSQLNLYLPWARNVRQRTQKVDVQHLLDKVLWDDLYNGSIPILGIKYSADDLIILGTAAMSVLTLWSVYSHRRENHCLGVLKDIAEDNKDLNPSLSAYIYSAVAHYFVFTTTTQNDEIYGEHSSEGNKTVLRWHVSFLTHLPWIASALCVAVTAVSIFFSGWILVEVPNPKIMPFLQFESYEQVEAILRLTWGLVFTVLTAYYCKRAEKFDKDTTNLLVKMEKSAKSKKVSP